MDDRTLASLDRHTRHCTRCIGNARRQTGSSPATNAEPAGPEPLPGRPETGAHSRAWHRAIVVPNPRLPETPLASQGILPVPSVGKMVVPGSHRVLRRQRLECLARDPGRKRSQPVHEVLNTVLRMHVAIDPVSPARRSSPRSVDGPKHLHQEFQGQGFEPRKQRHGKIAIREELRQIPDPAFRTDDVCLQLVQVRL